MKGVKNVPDDWRAVYDSAAPQEATFPKPFEEAADMIRLILVRCIRSDKVVPAVQVTSFSRCQNVCKACYFILPTIIMWSTSARPLACFR